jgi:hypothetical protein
MLLVVLYRYKTLSVTLNKEYKFWVFENRVQRRIFGSKTDAVTGDRRKLYNDELFDLNCLQNIIRMINTRKLS